VNWRTGSGFAALGVTRAANSSLPVSDCPRASPAKHKAHNARPTVKTDAFLMRES
jgi:hypothetical protein